MSKLKTFPLFNSRLSFILDNGLRAIIENVEKNIRLLGIKPGMRVLEVGCGSGFVTGYLSETAADGGFIISIDIQEKMINKAKIKRGILKNVDFRVENASDLKSVKDQDIDLVLLYYSLHEISGKDKAVSEFHRVLKQGGILSLREPRLEVFRKDRQLYKEFIEGQGFESAWNTAICDLLGCNLKFIKK
jgi:ubiquinone/menaquinone biosynthesis C-methylase UbiE